MTSGILTIQSDGGRRFGLPDLPGYYVTDARVNYENRRSPCECYQDMLEASNQDILIYLHNDLTIHDTDWLPRVLAPFDKPSVALVGMGGATGLATRDLYRKPFNIWNMVRSGYASNQTDAETHGARHTGTRRVAVLDAFVLAVRRDWLLSIGGWPVNHLTHHCLDLWLACEAARAQKETWQVGVSCTHHGGGVSTLPVYKDARWLQGGSMEQDHILPHKWIYDEYRDVLPIEIP